MTPILTTKLHIPPSISTLVHRPRLFQVLSNGLEHKLLLVSAPAGFGKTTAITSWLETKKLPVVWLSLDDNDSDLSRFMLYLISALQTNQPNIGQGILPVLASSQPISIDLMLTQLINDITQISEDFIIVFDDYHIIDSSEVDQAVSFLLEHSPPQMHIVITTREDPNLPLARLRGRGQLTELRAADLRFTDEESRQFLNTSMGLTLSPEHIVALEQRTEGWIVGLQLAAISLQPQQDTADFIESFTGSHHFVLDYLVEEVLNRQPPHIQDFLLKTSILNRLCAPLCDAIIQDAKYPSQTLLRDIQNANLFLVSLDNERYWFRYHYLFADLLRQRLLRDGTGFSTEDVDELHRQASIWYETKGLELEAFQHAIAINDIERAERLIESQGTPLYLRGIVQPILHWLESLPHHILDAHPSLWIAYASTLMLMGQHTSVEQKLNEAENALQNIELDDKAQDILGRIASMRATLAVIQNDVDAMIAYSNDALECLHPENLSIRVASHWTRGYAYQLQGHHQLARKAYQEVLQLSESGEKSFYVIVAIISLGQLQELDNQLHQACESYQSAIKLSGEPPHQIASQAFLGLARIHYQWNDLEAAQKYGKQCHKLIEQMENTDTTASYKVFLAYLHLSQRDFTRASDVLDEAESFVRRNKFMFRMPDIAEAQVRILIHRGNLNSALQLAETHNLILSQARIYLAQKNASRALEILEPFMQEEKGSKSQNEHLKGLVLQALVYHALNEQDAALEVLNASLALARRGGSIRIFVDEGEFMRELLSELASQGVRLDYVHKLLSAFDSPTPSHSSPTQPLIEPLSDRELEILRLIADGLSNREVSERLFIALNTVKGHNQNIYQKLQVKRRTEAVARAHELGLI